MAQYNSNYTGAQIDQAVGRVLNGGGSSGETVTITLTTNQSSHSDIIGATVKIKDNTEGGYLLQTTWQGSEISFEVPVPVNYTVEFGGVTNYQTPSNVTYNSRTGRSRSISVQYKTEVVTVTVNTNKSGVTAQGQTVTIAGTNYTVPANGVVSRKVAFGTNYSVSVNRKSGYSIPANQSFTANTTSRSVTMTYTQRNSGVYILDTNNELFTTSEWSSYSHGTAVGVAVLSSAHNFVVSKDGILQAPISNNPMQPCSGATAITNEATARQRYSGKADTAIMVAAYASQSHSIQTGCSNKTFANGKKGYLPSLGEMVMIINNITEINSCITAVGGTEISTNYAFWTSTYYGIFQSKYYTFWSVLPSTNAANSGSEQMNNFYGTPCCEY